MRNRMLRGILTLCIGAAASTASLAQAPMYIEPGGFSLGTTVGLADLWGDVGTKSPIDHYANGKYFDKPCFMGGMFIRYTVHPSFAVRLGMNYGTLYATDKWNDSKASDVNSDAYQRYLRNLNVKTNIWEGTLMFEVAPLRFSLKSKTSHKRMQPYLAFGVGAFHFKPQGEYKNRTTGVTKWVDLYDLHLEGDGFKYDGAPKSYNLWQMNVPLALGIKWDLGYQLALGVEYNYRYLFTDYLDNVSDKYVDPNYFEANLPPEKAAIARDMYDKSWWYDASVTHKTGDVRGNKAVNDGYSTFSFTFYYKIKRRSDPWWY